MGSNILPFFWHLSSGDKTTRLAASENLVSALESFEHQYQATASSSKHAAGVNGGENGDVDMEESEDDDEDEDDSDESGVEVDADDDDIAERKGKNGAEEDNSVQLDKAFEKSHSEDVRYSVKRLVRGLSSSRESSRLGFAVALTELLARVDSISPEYVISLVLRASLTSKSMKGIEERDAHFARLFGLGSIIESNLIFRPSATLDDFKLVLGELWALGEKKSWIRESAWFMILKAVKGLLEGQKEKVEWSEEAVKAILRRVYGYDEKEEQTAGSRKGKGMDWTEEKVALSVVLQQARPEMDWKTIFAPSFQKGNILSSSNLSLLGKILKGTTETATPTPTPSGAPVNHNSAATSTGSWKPQVHFAWDVILDEYFADTKKVKGDRAGFPDFYRVVVDESLFAPTSTPQRKYWGFEVFSKVLPLLSDQELPLIFTQNFMKCWMNHLSGEDRYLHKKALDIAKQVQDITKEKSMVGFALLSQLLGKNGSRNFDKITKTKTVENILGHLDVKGVEQYTDYIVRTILEAGQGEQIDAANVDSLRTWGFDQLLLLVRNHSVPKEEAWIARVLEFLLMHGLFIVEKSDKKTNVQALQSRPKPALSEAASSVARARFFAAVIEITVQPRIVKDGTGSKRVQGQDNAGKLWMTRCLDLVHQLEKDSKHVSALVDVDDEIIADRKKANKALKALSKATVSPDVRNGLEILLSFGILQTYHDDVKAYESLEDVIACAEALSQPTASSSTSEAPLPPIDLLIDVLLAFLDRGSNDLKSLASLVFGLVTDQVQTSSVEHLVAQLEQVGTGYQSDDDDDMEEEEEDGSDGEEQNGGDEDVADSDEDSVEEEEEEDAQVDPEFRRRVAEALQVAGMADGAEGGADDSEDDEDEEDESENEDAMDDEQMLALDEKLASIFKERRAGKKTNGIVESIHFKQRVVDLVDVYLRKQPTNPLILSFIPTLLQLSQNNSPTEKSLAEKCKGVFSKRFDHADEVPVVEDIEATEKILETIHTAARKNPNPEMAKALSNASIFISKALNQSKLEGGSEAAIKIYKASLKDYMTRSNSKLLPKFFQDYVQRQPQSAWPLHNDMVEYAVSEDVNEHHHMTALQMLASMAKLLGTIGKTDRKAATDFVEQARSIIYKALEEKGSATGNWSASQIKEVIKATLQIARSSQALYPGADDLAAAWAVEDLRNIELTLKQTERLGNTPSVFNLLGQLMLLVDPEAKAKIAAKKSEKQAERKRKLEDDKGVKDEVKAVDTPKKKKARKA